MPSLLGTTVAANYGRMTAQDTYATGPAFSNFGTRSLRLLKVVYSGGASLDLTKGPDGATGSYTDSLSLFSNAVRALQTQAEIYLVGVPSSTTFMALVAGDTIDDGASHVEDGSYTDLEAVVKSAVDSTGTIAITATGTAANPGIFVGGALGTFA